MLLAIDVGNSIIKFGVFNGLDLVDRFAVATKRDYTVEELSSDRLSFVGTRVGPIDRVFVSSVVPELEANLSETCRELFKVTPVFVDNTFDFGFAIDYRPPSAAGTDRLVNAYAAAEKYGRPVVAVSLGTAATIDIVSADNRYIGGMIAPGMYTMAEALHVKASKLPHVEIVEPDSVIGDSTENCIRSGVFYGYVGMVEGLIRRTIAEIGTAKAKPLVIATGGFAKPIAPHTDAFDVVDENLTLEGLRLLAESYA